MTARETTLLEKIRDELHEYHADVVRLTDKHKSVSEIVDKIVLDMYGNPADRENNPGVLSWITDLRRSRQLAKIGIRSLWGVVMLIAGAIVSWLFR